MRDRSCVSIGRFRLADASHRVPSRPCNPFLLYLEDRQMRFAQSVVMLAFLAVTFYYGANLVLDAAIREQEFQDNIRFARCERMDDFDRARMKGYCNQ